MNKNFEKLTEIIGRKHRSVFTNFNIGLVGHQEDLKKMKLINLRERRIDQDEYENPNGVYIKTLINGDTFSGIIETDSFEESRKLFYDLPILLSENGFFVTSLVILPLPRKSLHPFFDFFENIIFNYEDGMRDEYWKRLGLNVKSVTNWYYDYLKYRREIVYKYAPEVEQTHPFWIKPLKSFIIIYDDQKGIINRYYYSGDKDEVIINEMNKVDINELDNIYNDVFGVDKKDMIAEGRSHTSIDGKVYQSWNHPFLEALKDVKEGLIRYNESQPTLDYNAYQLTSSKINHWTYNEIRIAREMSEIFPEIKKFTRFWNSPLNVLNIYFIHPPEKNRRVDGRIVSFYVNGETDRIISTMTHDINETRADINIFRRYFPDNLNKPFLTSSRSITSYLSSKLGMKY